MDSKSKCKAPVQIQADADHEVVTTPLIEIVANNMEWPPILYQSQ